MTNLKIVYFIFFSSLFCACGINDEYDKIECNNLLLFYMAGDNSLNKAIYSDIEEIKQGLKNDGDIVLVFADKKTDDYYFDEWNEAKLLEYAVLDGLIIEKELENGSLGVSIEWLDDEVDSGSEKCLSSFLNFAKRRYKYKNIYLDLWNHGGGWKSGDDYLVNERNICYDEQTGNSLSMQELSNALQKSNIHYEIVIIDACCMGSIEVASVFQGFTDIIIFSQKEIPEDGFPYNLVIPSLFNSDSTENKAKQICSHYMNWYKIHNISISSIKIDLDNCLNCVLNEFNLYVNNIPDFTEIITNRNYCCELQNNVVDLIVFEEFCNNSKNIKNCIIFNSSNLEIGCSIFFPQFFDYSQDSWEYTSERIEFLRKCPNYLSFLINYQNVCTDISNNDLFEPNNHIEDSCIIDTQKTPYFSSKLWCLEDVDYFKIIKNTNIYSIELIEPLNHDYNISALLYKNSEFVKRIDDKNNILNFVDEDYDELYLKIYSSFGFWNQLYEYTVIIHS